MVPSFWVGLAVTTLGLLVLHWFPWPRKLPRLWAYAIGTASIVAGLGLWFGMQGLWVLLGGIFAIALAAGLAVIIAYQIDSIVLLIRMGKRAERMIDDGDA